MLLCLVRLVSCSACSKSLSNCRTLPRCIHLPWSAALTETTIFVMINSKWKYTIVCCKFKAWLVRWIFLLQPFQQVEQAFLETVYAFLCIIYGFADVVLRGLLTVLDRIGICEGSFSGFYGSFGE